ncbi:hypothetical protein EEJ34_13650 [Vibrio cholerae]|nr:hypothetical protein EEJ34_13650 [Vibrio cholerae]TQQ27199.1 hypothetical protein FLL67_15420 [Vibrio cholerae]
MIKTISIVQLTATLKNTLRLVINHKHNKRLKRDCQRVAFPILLSRSGYVGMFALGCNALPTP